MVLVQSVIQELQELPTSALLEVAQYVHQLRRLNPKRKNGGERLAALQALAGSISKEDANIMERVIEESDQISMHHDDYTW